MNALINSFKMFIKQILNDNMLILVCTLPVLAGIAFYYGIPVLDNLLSEHLQIKPIFISYYLLLDLLLCILTPYMFCFAASMVIISEFDEGISKSISVTPVGQKGYLVSRLVFPSIISCFICIVILGVFSLSNLSVYEIILISILSSAICIIQSMVIVSFSKNKVEALALAKLSGLLLLGIFIPFFIKTNLQYIFAFMPSFWLAKFSLSNNIVFFLLTVLSIFIWEFFLFKIFIRKFSK